MHCNGSSSQLGWRTNTGLVCVMQQRRLQPVAEQMLSIMDTTKTQQKHKD
jgi:hypothetical protein